MSKREKIRQAQQHPCPICLAAPSQSCRGWACERVHITQIRMRLGYHEERHPDYVPPEVLGAETAP